MRYDVMSNPVRKDSVYYEYDAASHPNAVSRAGGKVFGYDANGNLVSVEDTTSNTLRVMQWDEEDRLQALGDDGYVSRYTYNHAGERVVKSHGRTTVAFVNGALQGVLWHDRDNWTMYVSPYMVVSPDRFTKHYYAGSQRIASKIGTGSLNNLYDAAKACVTAGQKDYAERLNLITQSRNDYYAALGIPPGPPTAEGVYGEAEYRGEYGDYMTAPLGNYNVPEGWPMKPYKRPYGGTPGPPVMYENPSNPDDEGAGYGFKSAGTKEKDVYFYHSDHLGSTNYITDRDGNATQFVSYKPYGEALVDEHSTSFETPWKFNGKELDAETGLYYYGARYYEPTLALFYGIDRYAEKFPWKSAYVYAEGNPIKYIDENGDSLKANSPEVQQNIINTLSVDEANYVRFNENGILDSDLLKSGEFCSENYISLLKLAESDIFYNFYIEDKVGNVEFYEQGQHHVDKKAYSYGITLLPGAENNSSPDNNVHIYTACFLSCSKQVTNTAHEGYGHAYLYELSRYDNTINPNHTWGVIVKDIYDDYWNAYVPTNINYLNNRTLEDRISVVTKEALINYESRF